MNEMPLKPDNPPAFPSKKIDHRESAEQSRTVYEGQDYGMSLRDYFAAKALPALIECMAKSSQTYSESAIAEKCYKMADEMLKQREL